MDDLLDRVTAKMLVDCYDEHEEQTAFLRVLSEEISCPARATPLGVDVTVTALDLVGNRREANTGR